MKSWLTAVLVVVATIVAGAGVQAQLPVGPPVPVPAPASNKDGPYRLYMAAKIDARHRRTQGFRADPVKENGQWWVIYYR